MTTGKKISPLIVKAHSGPSAMSGNGLELEVDNESTLISLNGSDFLALKLNKKTGGKSGDYLSKNQEQNK